MKRFTKILCLVMALALLCVGLAFIVSAEETNTVKIVAKDGTETYYLDYDAAMTQLKNGDTVVLLADTAASGKGYNSFGFPPLCQSGNTRFFYILIVYQIH